MADTPKRIQRSRAKGWRMPAGAVFVGRPTKWGNPYKVGTPAAPTPEAAVALFRDYLARRTEIVEEAREELKGRSLACWCPLGQPCHADVLLELANQGQAMTSQCTQRQVELLHHTLGLSIDHRDPYRNHFVAGPGHHDMPDLEALEALGLMARSPTPKFCADSDIVFRVTDAGRAVALDSLPPPPKPTRYGEWLDADCCDSFGEFLCGSRLPTLDARRQYEDGKARWQWRMYRRARFGDREITGEWADTKKAAKASYKAALKAHQQAQRAQAMPGATKEPRA